MNLPLGLNGNHALLAKASPLQCHPTAKRCGPCKEVSTLAGALAAGSAAGSDDSDTEAADRLTPCISLWTSGSWSDHCASRSSHAPSLVPWVGLDVEVKSFS